MKTSSWITGFLLGAGVMYLLDPQSGRRRRALGRDKTRHLVKAAGARSGKRGRDLANRARGLAHTVGGVVRRDRVDDAVLHERVRAELGRHVSNPSAIEVACADGACTLRGPVPAMRTGCASQPSRAAPPSDGSSVRRSAVSRSWCSGGSARSHCARPAASASSTSSSRRLMRVSCSVESLIAPQGRPAAGNP